ncbi:MAG: hypothetical protein U0528_17060 [Anaerolineae bacterium]|nr:hypothetical protein [Anaerolineae bacterium]
MPWTTPNTAIASTVISSSAHNTYIRDNLNYLHSGRPIAKVQYEGSVDRTNSTNSWADVDATNLSVTLTISSGRARVFASFRLAADNTTNSSAEADLIVDGTTRAGATHGLVRVSQNRDHQCAIEAIFSGLSVGSHTFRLQIRNVTNGAVATVINNGYPITIIVEEC